MMNGFQNSRQSDFAVWLRTGRRPPVCGDGIELKFNPYHDPRNGQFTFAPGGPRSLSNVRISDGRGGALRGAGIAPRSERSGPSGALYRPGAGAGSATLASFPRNPRASRGGNIRAFQDPMTLEQVFPGLGDRPSGAIIALADTIFDFTGPAHDLAGDLTRAQSNILIDQIRALDPSY